MKKEKVEGMRRELRKRKYSRSNEEGIEKEEVEVRRRIKRKTVERRRRGRRKRR
jgi:hypothetical protein